MRDFAPSVRDNLTLVVVRPSGKRYLAKKIPTGDPVTQQLRGVAHNALQLIADGTGRQYDPDDEQGDADFLIVPQEEVVDTELLQAIDPGPSLAPLTRDDNWHRLFCYAVMIEDANSARTVLLRKGSPIRLATKRLVTRLMGDHLDRIEEPIFAFDDQFDVVIRGGVIRALRQEHFEQLFKSTPVVLRKLDEWTTTTFEQLPISAPALEAFKERATKNSRTLRKLQSIASKPYLRSLTLDQFRQFAIGNRLDVCMLIQDGQINLCPETERDILALLNEDLFEGSLSKSAYIVSRKATRNTPSQS